jgi:hypothetical protein
LSDKEQTIKQIIIMAYDFLFEEEAEALINFYSRGDIKNPATLAFAIRKLKNKLHTNIDAINELDKRIAEKLREKYAEEVKKSEKMGLP